jgi:hypothetical protein
MAIVLIQGAAMAQSVYRQATGRGKEIFIYSTGSRPALGPTHPPIQWVPRVLSSGIKLPGRETDHSPPSSADVKNGGAIPPLPHMSS